MILFVIVGGVFALIGGALLYMRFYFLKHADRVWGKVIAIEKTISHHRSGSSSSSSVTYRPIVEYVFRGETYWFSAGGSSNNIYKFKIDQRVGVLSLDKGPEYVMLEDGILGTMGKIFFVIGSLLFGFGIWQIFKKPPQTMTDWLWDYGVLLFIIPPTFVVFSKIKKHFEKSDTNIAEQMLKAAKLETDETLRKRKVYWTRKQLQNEVGNINRIGYAMSSIFLILCLVGLGFTWQWMTPETRDLILGSITNLDNLNEIMALVKKKDPKIIAFLIALFFSLMGTHSFIYSMRKMNS